jgi:hypothetical protein
MSITDMDRIDGLIGQLAEAFDVDMGGLFDEAPEIFEGRSTESEWMLQCSKASTELAELIEAAVQKVEIQLHDGQYHPQWAVGCMVGKED